MAKQITTTMQKGQIYCFKRPNGNNVPKCLRSCSSIGMSNLVFAFIFHLRSPSSSLLKKWYESEKSHLTIVKRPSLSRFLFHFCQWYWNRFHLLKRWKRKSRCQFHQHFTSIFFVQKSFEHLFCTYILGLYSFGARKLAQKLLVKCWWNWP